MTHVLFPRTRYSPLSFLALFFSSLIIKRGWVEARVRVKLKAFFLHLYGPRIAVRLLGLRGVGNSLRDPAQWFLWLSRPSGLTYLKFRVTLFSRKTRRRLGGPTNSPRQ